MEQLSVQTVVATGAINSCEQPKLLKSTSKLCGLKFLFPNFVSVRLSFICLQLISTRLLTNIAVLLATEEFIIKRKHEDSYRF